MVAFCGLGCHECGAFLATQENDSQKRAEVAQEWSRLFKMEIKPEDRRLFNYCNVLCRSHPY